jgi:hypothetical protein
VSVRMMTLVWELDLPDSEKLVLLALADCANDEGHCWPGMTTLKKKCSKSDRTVQLAIKMLCAKGHLTRREILGKGCNYTVHPIVRFSSDPRSDNAPEVTTPPKGTTQTPEAASGKPSRTIIPSEAKASSGRTRGCRLPDDWKPSETEIAFAKRLGHTDESIAAIAEIYADYWRSQPGQRGVKTDWPATWRNWIRREAKSERVASPKYVSASGYQYRGDERAVMKEAERRGDYTTYYAAKGNLERDAA